MNIPEELRYTKSHEWLKEEDGVCTVGLTDFAQHALGDIVFVNLPQEGDPVTAGEALGDVESVKAPASPASWRECGLFWPRYRPCWRPPASMYRAGPPTASTSTGQICCWLFWKSGAD